MNTLLQDTNRTIAVFVNDFNPAFAEGLKKLSQDLGRPLSGVLLVDRELKEQGSLIEDSSHTFKEIVCDFSDTAELAQVLAPLKKQILLITCSAERNQPYLKRVLPHLPYIYGPSESSLDWATHKAKMRELLGSYDSSLVPAVQPVLSADEHEVQNVLSKLTFPIIVKPTGLAASVLVSKVHNEEELRKTLTESFAVIEDIYKRDGGRGKPSMIAEEFIEGDMYAVDAYVNDKGQVWVLPLFRSLTGYAAGKTGFHIYQEDSYLTLTDEEIAAGQVAATQAVHALGLRSCLAHIELFHTAEGWKVIELGPRAGGQRQDMYFAAYGIDHAYNELRLKVGLEPIITTKPVAYITIVRLYADEEGILERVEGFEEAQAVPSIYNLRMRTEIGELASPSDRGGKVVLDGVLRNTDLDQLYKDAETVRSLITIIIKASK